MRLTSQRCAPQCDIELKLEREREGERGDSDNARREERWSIHRVREKIVEAKNLVGGSQ